MSEMNYLTDSDGCTVFGVDGEPMTEADKTRNDLEFENDRLRVALNKIQDEAIEAARHGDCLGAALFRIRKIVATALGDANSG